MGANKGIKLRKHPPGVIADIKTEFWFADYEWLALRDLASLMGKSRTMVLMEAVARYSEDVLGYDLFAAYREGAYPTKKGLPRRR
jgi:hypothetical protein